MQFEQSVWADWKTGDDFELLTVLDANGDGRKDLIARNTLIKKWRIAYSTGTSFVTSTGAEPLNGMSSTGLQQPLVADADMTKTATKTCSFMTR